MSSTAGEDSIGNARNCFNSNWAFVVKYLEEGETLCKVRLSALRRGNVRMDRRIKGLAQLHYTCTEVALPHKGVDTLSSTNTGPPSNIPANNVRIRSHVWTPSIE